MGLFVYLINSRIYIFRDSKFGTSLNTFESSCSFKNEHNLRGFFFEGLSQTLGFLHAAPWCTRITKSVLWDLTAVEPF